MERGDGERPDDAVVVVVLLDAGGHGAADADAVAAHEDDLLLAVGIEEGGIQRLGILGAEFEDMTDLDAAPHLQHAAAAARAGIAVGDVADVGKLRQREVALRVDVFQVVIRFVGAGNEIAHPLDRQVGNDADLEADRPGKADRRPGDLATICSSVGQLQLLAAEDFFSLISFRSWSPRTSSSHRLAVGHETSSLDRGTRSARRGKSQPPRWSSSPEWPPAPAGAAQQCSGRLNEAGFGLLHVGGVVAGVAGDDGVLAGFGQHHELVGTVAADGAGVGLHGPELEAAALEDAAVGLVHLFVG